MASIEEVDTLPETERYAYSRDWGYQYRGAGGFGSTGVEGVEMIHKKPRHD